MKRSTLIIVATALAIAAVIGFFLINKKNSLNTQASTSVSSLPKGEEVSYDLKMHLVQRPEDQNEIDLFYIEGVFTAYGQDDGSLVSEWTKIADFKMLAKPVAESVTAAMVNRPFVTKRSGQKFEHSVGMEFPGRFLGLQINILDKAWITEHTFKDQKETRQERDEMGLYSVEYSYARANEGYLVTRRWVQSLDGKSILDANDNQMVYLYNSDGILQSVKGRLVVNYKAGSRVDVYTTEFSMDIKGQAKVSDSKLSRNTKNLPLADLSRAEVASQAALASDEGEEGIQERARNLDEALVRVDTFTRESPGEEQQEIFTDIKLGLMANPADTAKVMDKIVAIKATDDDAEARSALLFGAVTASGLPQVADSLVDLAESKCPDQFCKIQAVTSLNIHAHPSESNGKAILSLARESKDEDVATAAYMAAGSIAGKSNTNSPDITQALLSDIKTAGSEDRKLAVIKAMGNHGSADYLPALEASAKVDDTFEKASALYSMRYLPSETVTPLLIGAMNVEGSDIVNVNALRALGDKALSAETSMKVAETFASSTDKDVQSALTDVLLSSYRANAAGAEEAINFLREKASDANVKAYLDDQLKEIAEDRRKDANYQK